MSMPYLHDGGDGESDLMIALDSLEKTVVGLVEAVAEHDDLMSRVEELEKSIEELKSAVADIENVIEELPSFVHLFKAVQEIQQTFEAPAMLFTHYIAGGKQE